MKKRYLSAQLQSATIVLGAVAIAVTWAAAQNEKTETTADTAANPQSQQKQKSDTAFTAWPAMPARPFDSSKLYSVPVTEPTPAPHPNDPLHEATLSHSFAASSLMLRRFMSPIKVAPTPYS